ncbi:MAG: glycerol-3-phosphate dehydrogenase [Caulobacter sp.]|nr:glycerol-3-phosphate dehydrogenase [Caulobacter sp.]
MAAAAEPSNDTDALGGTNPSDAPALALANLYMATSQALSIAVHNAANIQQQVAITAQSALTMALSTLFSLDTAAEGEDKAKARPAPSCPTPFPRRRWTGRGSRWTRC